MFSPLFFPPCLTIRSLLLARFLPDYGLSMRKLSPPRCFDTKSAEPYDATCPQVPHPREFRRFLTLRSPFSRRSIRGFYRLRLPPRAAPGLPPFYANVKQKMVPLHRLLTFGPIFPLARRQFSPLGRDGLSFLSPSRRCVSSALTLCIVSQRILPTPDTRDSTSARNSFPLSTPFILW